MLRTLAKLRQTIGIARPLSSGLKDDAISRRLARGAFWTLLGAVSSRGSMFLVYLTLARIISSDSIGEFGAIESTIALLGLFGNVALGVTSTKYVARHRKSDPERTGRVIGQCLLLACVAGLLAVTLLLVFAQPLAQQGLAAPHLSFELKIAAAVLLLNAINGTLAGVLAGLQSHRTLAGVSLVVGIANLVVLIAGATWGGVFGMVTGLVIVQTIALALHGLGSVVALRAHAIPFQFSWNWEEFRSLISFSFPTLLNSSVVAPVNWLCISMLVNLGGGYHQMGLLQVANTWFFLALFVPVRLSTVYYPLMEEMYAKGDRQAILRFTRRLATFNLIVCGVAAMLVTLLSSQVLQLYGEAYRSARPTLIITVWAAVIMASYQPLTSLTITRSRIWRLVCCSLGWALMTLFVTYTLIGWGATAVALGRLSGSLVYAVMITHAAFSSFTSDFPENEAAHKHLRSEANLPSVAEAA